MLLIFKLFPLLKYMVACLRFYIISQFVDFIYLFTAKFLVYSIYLTPVLRPKFLRRTSTVTLLSSFVPFRCNLILTLNSFLQNLLRDEILSNQVLNCLCVNFTCF